MRVAGVQTHVRDEGDGGIPIVCLHGNPDSGDQWAPLLARAREGRLGRVIAPDLPGWGRSERPDPARFDGSIDAHDRWFEGLLDGLQLERFSLVVHDWGALALSAASRRPEAVHRLVVVDAVPLSADYRWHWVARVWRTPRAGEALMHVLSPWMVKQVTRLPSPHWRPMPDAWVAEIAPHLDAGMKAAILRLYRSADPAALGRHGERLAALRCPALVLWGEGDPYVGLDHARAYARTLPAAELEIAPGVGHWCFRERPELYDRIAAFVAGERG